MEGKFFSQKGADLLILKLMNIKCNGQIMKEFQRNLNTIVIHNSNTDLGGNSNSNSNILIFNVIVMYYIDLGSNCNSNSNNYTDF